MSKGSGGGGYGSRVHVEKPIRTGSGSYATTPGYTGQLGNKQGDHITRGGSSGYRGEPMHVGRSFQPVPFGNQVALNVGKGGPGTGRDVHASGSQGTHGGADPGNPRPQQGDILNQYGPNYRRPRNDPANRSDTDADF
jgi:hypothetical protein